MSRREVDGWLARVESDLSSVLRGPAGELRARLVLLQRQLERWRDRLGIRR